MHNLYLWWYWFNPLHKRLVVHASCCCCCFSLVLLSSLHFDDNRYDKESGMCRKWQSIDCSIFWHLILWYLFVVYVLVAWLEKKKATSFACMWATNAMKTNEKFRWTRWIKVVVDSVEVSLAIAMWMHINQHAFACPDRIVCADITHWISFHCYRCHCWCYCHSYCYCCCYWIWCYCCCCRRC